MVTTVTVVPLKPIVKTIVFLVSVTDLSTPRLVLPRLLPVLPPRLLLPRLLPLLLVLVILDPRV